MASNLGEGGRSPVHICAGLTRFLPDDILRARLKTVGVTEFRFEINKSEILGKFGPGASLSSGWHVYDVGGHRSMVRCSSLFLSCGLFLTNVSSE